MPNPLRDLLFGTVQAKRELVEALTPRRTFNDVILPPATRRALDQALVQIKKHDLIFHTWGLAERHNTGLGLAFNFAGPPGTGKTVCAEAIAHALQKRLLVVRYSEMESLWAGETGKNVSAVFRAAAEQDAVLFFDEADAIAGRRFSSVTQGYQREANTVVNVLLKELEDFAGVVIFATNLAANFDPAFERRIRTHVLFEMPDAATREKIWRVQLHARKTPLDADVDFKALAEQFDNISGGDIKNAVLKAAQMATVEPGADSEKRIAQRHFVQGIKDVLSSKKVMEQSIFDGDGSHSSSSQASAMSALTGLNGAWSQLSRSHEELEETVQELAERVREMQNKTLALPGIVERFDDASRAAQVQMRAELVKRLDELESKPARDEETTSALNQVREEIAALSVAVPQMSTALQQERAEMQTQLQKLEAQTEAQRAAFQTLQQASGQLATRLEAQETQLAAHEAQLETRLETQRASGLAALRDAESAWQGKWRASVSIAVAALAAAGGALITAFLR